MPGLLFFLVGQKWQITVFQECKFTQQLTDYFIAEDDTLC